MLRQISEPPYQRNNNQHECLRNCENNVKQQVNCYFD